MAKRLNDIADVRVAVAASAGVVGALVGTAIDATGFSRARFIFNFGNGAATTAALSSYIGVWKASTSGATFSSVPTAVLAAVTSGVLSSNSLTMVIDMPTDSANPWLKVSGGSMLSTAIPHSAVVELYDGINNPPTTSTQQLVTI